MPKKNKSKKNVKVNDLRAKEDPKGGFQQVWPIKYSGPSTTTTLTTTTTTTTKAKQKP